MKIVKDYPPNYEDICEAIPGVRGEDSICFTYGDTVYSPSTDNFPDHLIAHESVHMRQQSGIGPDAWWSRYLKDTRFRLDQEIEAYREQYQLVLKRHGRANATLLLRDITNDLSSAMYGNILSHKQARKEIIKK